jgi:hypothetical protein
VRWSLNDVLICISFITKDVEHFFIYISPIYMFSFENCLFNSFAHVLIKLFILLMFNFNLYIC